MSCSACNSAVLVDDWIVRCSQCDKVSLKPIARGLKYVKTPCSGSPKYYRVEEDKTHTNCTCCHREFVIENCQFDESVGCMVYTARASQVVYYELVDKVASVKKDMALYNSPSTMRKDSRRLRNHLAGNGNWLRQTKERIQQLEKELREIGQSKTDSKDVEERLEHLHEENGELEKEREMLFRLKNIRGTCPEITLEIMELANLRKELDELRPMLEKEKTQFQKHMVNRHVFNSVSETNTTLGKKIDELDGKNSLCEGELDLHDRLEEKRNAKLAEAKENYLEADKTLDDKNKELNKLLDYSMVKVFNLLDEIKDFSEAQLRRKNSPLLKLAQGSWNDTDVLLDYLRDSAELLVSQDCSFRGHLHDSLSLSIENLSLDETQVTETDVYEATRAPDFSVPPVSHSSESQPEDQSSKAESVVAEEIETEDSSSVGSFEVLQQGAAWELV